jgi:hypothetical protein
VRGTYVAAAQERRVYERARQDIGTTSDLQLRNIYLKFHDASKRYIDSVKTHMGENGCLGRFSLGLGESLSMMSCMGVQKNTDDVPTVDLSILIDIQIQDLRSKGIPMKVDEFAEVIISDKGSIFPQDISSEERYKFIKLYTKERADAIQGGRRGQKRITDNNGQQKRVVKTQSTKKDNAATQTYTNVSPSESAQQPPGPSAANTFASPQPSSSNILSRVTNSASPYNPDATSFPNMPSAPFGIYLPGQKRPHRATNDSQDVGGFNMSTSSQSALLNALPPAREQSEDPIPEPLEQTTTELDVKSIENTHALVHGLRPIITYAKDNQAAIATNHIGLLKMVKDRLNDYKEMVQDHPFGLTNFNDETFEVVRAQVTAIEMTFNTKKESLVSWLDVQNDEVRRWVADNDTCGFLNDVLNKKQRRGRSPQQGRSQENTGSQQRAPAGVAEQRARSLSKASQCTRSSTPSDDRSKTNAGIQARSHSKDHHRTNR